MKSIITAILFLVVASSFAQSKNEIIQKGIEVKRYYDQDLKDGEKEPYLYKEEFFNFQGEIVEMKEYTDQGDDLDKWFKYKYDDNANLIEELELNEKGEQKERIVYKFEKGLRVEKLYYDDKDRLKQRRTYEYGFRK